MSSSSSSVARRAKRLVPRVPWLWTAAKGAQAFRSPTSGLVSSGYARSLLEQRPCDKDGRPVPWMSYPMIHLMTERLRPDMILFEYGSGASTRWFVDRVHSVHAVENDAAWHAQVIADVAGTGAVVSLETEERRYVGAIAEPGLTFDVVIADGWRRSECCRTAIRYLSPGGVIVLDDSERPKFAGAFVHLHRAGFRHLTMTGVKPAGWAESSTTVFYRDGNCWGL